MNYVFFLSINGGDTCLYKHFGDLIHAVVVVYQFWHFIAAYELFVLFFSSVLLTGVGFETVRMRRGHLTLRCTSSLPWVSEGFFLTYLCYKGRKILEFADCVQTLYGNAGFVAYTG